MGLSKQQLFNFQQWSNCIIAPITIKRSMCIWKESFILQAILFERMEKYLFYCALKYIPTAKYNRSVYLTQNHFLTHMFSYRIDCCKIFWLNFEHRYYFIQIIMLLTQTLMHVYIIWEIRERRNIFSLIKTCINILRSLYVIYGIKVSSLNAQIICFVNWLLLTQSI